MSLLDDIHDPKPPITIADACKKYGIDRKKLMGKIWQNDYNSPITVGPQLAKKASLKDARKVLILDNWALHRLATKSVPTFV